MKSTLSQTKSKKSSLKQIKGKILVVDDEKDLLGLLKHNLGLEGFLVQTATNAESAIKLMRVHKPELMIVDIMLPKMDGIELCKAIRQESQIPIIFLTAKKNEVDRVLGLKMGADDYVTKPFSINELIARVHVVLRRTQKNVLTEKKEKRIVSGAIEIDIDGHEVRVRNKYVNLSPKEYELLKLLIEANGEVLSRDHLLERLWGTEKGSEIYTRTVDQHIARLRKKLRPEEDRIETLSHFGYKINLR